MIPEARVFIERIRRSRPARAAGRGAKQNPCPRLHVPYAIGNILLMAWGPVLVALMSI